MPDQRRSWVRLRTDPRAPVAAACALWLVRYLIAIGLRVDRAPFWAGWFDQGKYIESATAFARGDLSAAHHWYPLLYSLLAAPFAILPDAFLLPDLLLFAWFFCSLRGLFAMFGVGRWTALLILVATSLVIDGTAGLWVVPWTTTLSAALIVAAMVLIVDMADADPPTVGRTGRRQRALGLLLGAMPLARPTDALLSAVLALAAGAILWRRGRLTIASVVRLVAGALCVAVPYALLYLAIYGASPTGYMIEAARQGFTFGDLPWKSYVLLVTARPWYPDAPSLVEGLPWVIPGVAGLALAAWRSPTGDRQRLVLALFCLTAVPYSLLFLAYTDLQPSGLWRFNNVHYFKWLLPFFGLGAWLWAKAMLTRRDRLAALVTLVAVMLPACVRILPRPVDDGVPARLLLFKGRADRDWNEAYFASAVVTDRAGPMRNVREFHQLPDRQGERAVAITRLFLAGPVRNDAGEPMPYARDEKPTNRFAERMSVGIPCWFKPSACDLPQGR